MKGLCSILLLAFAVPAWADEAADRVDIARVIAALNKVPQSSDLFEGNADSSTLDGLWKGKTVQFRPLAVPELGGPPAVIISHEPWGEARIGGPLPAIEAVNPRISAGKVQFVSPDVALADGEFIYSGDKGSQAAPLLFVMKREGAAWKIAAVRRLAPASLTPAH